MLGIASVNGTFHSIHFFSALLIGFVLILLMYSFLSLSLLFLSYPILFMILGFQAEILATIVLNFSLPLMAYYLLTSGVF